VRLGIKSNLDLYAERVIIQPLNIPTLLREGRLYQRLMEDSTENARDLILLEQIEQNPDATQASLAVQLDVAVGTINWHLKRLINKGYVKVRRAERRKLLYIITPEGIALRARLTVDYVQTQLRLYRQTRQRTRELLEQMHQAGFNHVQLVGEGDIADICRLTCLEHGFTVVNDTDAPILEVRGMKVFLQMEKQHG
jgi:DNA-binding MarR family transcriptional regulator